MLEYKVRQRLTIKLRTQNDRNESAMVKLHSTVHQAASFQFYC